MSMSTMKMIRFWLFAAVIVAGSPVWLNASHIIGGEITYRCLGNNQYELTISIFRDCFYGAADAPFDNPASVGIFDNNTNELLREIRIPFMGDDTLRSFLFDPCYVVPPTVCVHTTTYRDTVELLPRAGGYHIAYQRCCRNQTINNILIPDRTGATYSIIITEEALTSCNNSPVFKEWPPIFICLGTTINYDHSAIDADGDSLVYRLCTPYAGASFGVPKPQPPSPPPYDTVRWITPTYNLQNLLGSGDPLRIDLNTGLLQGRPDLQGQFVVGVCIEEYRDGQLLSMTRRDFQYNVGICGQITAAFQAPSVQCDNRTVTFDNRSQFSFDFKWIFDYPNGTDTSRLFEPTYTYPDTGLYTVALIAEPGSSCADTFFADILIQDNTIDIDYSIASFDCVDSTQLVISNNTTDPYSPIVSWEWVVRWPGDSVTSNLEDPIFIVPNPNAIEVELTARTRNGCVKTSKRDFLVESLDPTESIRDSLSICEGGSIELNPNGDPNFVYNWTPTTGLLTPANIANPIAAPTTTTVYTVVVSYNNQFCTRRKDVTVTVQPTPTLDFETELDCDDRTVHFTNRSLTGTLTDFGWDFGEPANPNNTSTQSNPSHTFLDEGTYQVRLYLGSTSLCKDTLTKDVVVENRTLDADYDFEYLNCEPGNLTVEFNDRSVNSANHTVTGWNWQFTPGGTASGQTTQISVNESTDLEVKLLITTAQGCQDSITKDLDLNMVEQYPPDVQLICGGSSTPLNPNANPSYRYEWTPSTGLDDPFSPNPTATLTTSQDYVVKISAFGADTCDVLWNVSVTVPDSIGLLTSGDNLTCDTTAILRAFTSSPSVATITWYDSNNNIVGTGNVLTVPVSGLATYTVTAVDSFNCSASEQVIVGGGTVDVEVSGDQLFCLGDPYDVSVTNLDLNDTLVIQWTAPSGVILSGANTANPVLADTIGIFWLYVEIRNQFGCEYFDSLLVTIVDPAMEFDFDFSILCDGLKVEFENRSTNAFDYIWDFGDPSTNADTSRLENPTYTYSAIGNYLVTLTTIHDAGCSDTIAKMVNLSDNVLEANFEYSYSECSENAVTIDFVNTSTSLQNNIIRYEWHFFTNPNATSTQRDTSLTLTESDTFDVRLIVENSVGCIDTIVKTVRIDLIKLDLPEDVLIGCEGEDVFLNPRFNPNYQYEWSPANQVDNPTSPNPRVTVTQPGTYVFTVIVRNFGADTCEVEKQVEVRLPEPIDLQIVGDTATCGWPKLLSAAGNGISTYQWTNRGNQVGVDPTLVIDPADVETYILTVADIYGCKETDSLTVTNRQVDIRTSGDSKSCENSHTQIGVTNLDPIDSLTYTWTPTDRIVSGGNTENPVVATDITGPNIFFVEAINQFGCRDTGIVTLEVLNFDPKYDDMEELCSGVPTAINTQFDPTQNYQWIPPDGLSDPNSPSPIATLMQDRTYQLIIWQMVDDLTCRDTVEVLVEVRTPFQLTASPDETVCELRLVELFADAPGFDLMYEWSDTPDFTNILSTDSILLVTNKGIYTFYVRAKDDLGCTGIDTINLNIVPIEVIVEGDTIICINHPEIIEVTNLNPEQTLTFNWSPAEDVSDPTSQSPEVNPDRTTVFTADIRNNFGCTTTEEVTIEVIDLDLLVTATADPDSILPGDKSQLMVTQLNGFNYNWSPANTLNSATIFNPEASPNVTTTYTVVVTDENGCVTEREVLVTVFDPVCDEPYIFLPNAFSPNGDEENDVLYLRADYVDEMHLVIYNRWGQKVFETRNKYEGWDGTFKGEEVSPDVYAFYLTVRCINAKEFFKKGNVTLMR